MEELGQRRVHSRGNECHRENSVCRRVSTHIFPTARRDTPLDRDADESCRNRTPTIRGLGSGTPLAEMLALIHGYEIKQASYRCRHFSCRRPSPRQPDCRRSRFGVPSARPGPWRPRGAAVFGRRDRNLRNGWETIETIGKRRYERRDWRGSARQALPFAPGPYRKIVTRRSRSRCRCVMRVSIGSQIAPLLARRGPLDQRRTWSCQVPRPLFSPRQTPSRSLTCLSLIVVLSSNFRQASGPA